MKLLKLLILLFPIIILSQNIDKDSKIMAIGRYKNNQILLRWACTDITSWKKSNIHGFTIERYAIAYNGVSLKDPIKTIISSTAIKPEPLEKWESIIETNNYAAIIAQALYGESFMVDGEDSENENALGQIINQASEAEQRYSFSLFAADMSFEAAVKAGWGFIDTDITAGYEYLYRIKSLTPKDAHTISDGVVLINTTLKTTLPAPADLFAFGEDKSIRISWEYENLKDIYTSYFIERSEDNKTFTRLNKEPYVNLNDHTDLHYKNNTYIDTISQNNKTYHYRIVGISSFGEEGEASKSISAKGVTKQVATPHIWDFQFNDKGDVLLQWDFPAEAETNITGFELNRSSKTEGPFQTVQRAISPTTRKTTYNNLDPSNYFTISAIGKDNSKKTSMVKFVQTIDSIPPAIPIELKGSIDTLGIVKLRWKANLEKDLLGYRVFRGNAIDTEFTQITTSPIISNTINDTVAIKSLNIAVFYKVIAVDKRFNMSDYSHPIEIIKPDVIPPTSPVIKSYTITDQGIMLEWIKSSSQDVVSHLVFKQDITAGDIDWIQIASVQKDATYIDKNITQSHTYRYVLIAQDKSGLQSKPSTPVSLTVKSTKPIDAIKRFTGIADRVNQQIVLGWKLIPEDVAEILLYKNKKGEKPQLLKQYPATITFYNDTKVNPNSVYEYHLHALLKNGLPSQTQTIEVVY